MVDVEKALEAAIAIQREVFKESSRQLTPHFPTPDEVFEARRIKKTFENERIGSWTMDQRRIYSLADHFGIYEDEFEHLHTVWKGRISYPNRSVVMNEGGALVYIITTCSDAGGGGFSYDSEVGDSDFVASIGNFYFPP